MSDSKEALRRAQDALRAAQEDERRLAEEAAAVERRRLAAREALDKAAAEKRQQHNAMLLSVLTPDVVDALAPEHTRRGCSDDSRDYVGGRCARCTLLVALRDGYMEGSWAFTTSEES